MTKNLPDGLYFIATGKEPEKLLHLSEVVCIAGCRLLQLRMKEVSDDLYLSTAKKFVDICNKYNAVSIINDSVDIALKSGASGVHLGKNDTALQEARTKAADLIIGATADCYERLIYAAQNGADYVGLGPYRYTTTKANLSPILGQKGISEIMKRYSDSNVNKIPVYAIGGIEDKDVKILMQCGVQGVCISSFISESKNPMQTVKELLLQLK